MPAGSSFLISEGMLGDRLYRSTDDWHGTIKDYYWFEIRNQGLHAVHPLGWIRRLTIDVNGVLIPDCSVYFVLRGQWIPASFLKEIQDIYWYFCEVARICIVDTKAINSGENVIRVSIATSRLDQTSILDEKGIWPLREQTLEKTMRYEEES